MLLPLVLKVVADVHGVEIYLIFYTLSRVVCNHCNIFEWGQRSSDVMPGCSRAVVNSVSDIPPVLIVVGSINLYPSNVGRVTVYPNFAAR
jgi:hypothetical protein